MSFWERQRGGDDRRQDDPPARTVHMPGTFTQRSSASRTVTSSRTVASSRTVTSSRPEEERAASTTSQRTQGRRRAASLDLPHVHNKRRREQSSPREDDRRDRDRPRDRGRAQSARASRIPAGSQREFSRGPLRLTRADSPRSTTRLTPRGDRDRVDLDDRDARDRRDDRGQRPSSSAGGKGNHPREKRDAKGQGWDQSHKGGSRRYPSKGRRRSGQHNDRRPGSPPGKCGQSHREHGRREESEGKGATKS